jgi:hypothetical protein
MGLGDWYFRDGLDSGRGWAFPRKRAGGGVARGEGFPCNPQPMLEGHSLGLSPGQQDVFATTTSFCEPLLARDSIDAL